MRSSFLENPSEKDDPPMLASIPKPVAFSFVVAFALVGCSAPPEGAPLAEHDEAPLLAPTPKPPSHSAPMTEFEVQPPMPPTPLPPSPPPACLRIMTCMRGMQFDATPGVCMCVPIPDPGPEPVCAQFTQCMSGLVFDSTPGVCMCVPQG
jgi:hypothetical protein